MPGREAVTGTGRVCLSICVHFVVCIYNMCADVVVLEMPCLCLLNSFNKCLANNSTHDLLAYI